jgi:hypothetical protein
MQFIRLIGGASLVAFGLAGCAGSGPSAEQEAAQAKAQETIDQILAAPLPSEEYVKGERCISTMQYDSMEVLDDRHVLFQGTGDRIWLNTLRSRCIGLRRDSTPVIRLRDTQLCDMDTFQAVDDMLGVWTRTSATCSLGTFTRISREQADGIRAALKEARQSR